MPRTSHREQSPGWDQGALPLAAACPGVATTSCTLARSGVRPQTPQSATWMHTGFLINYLSLSGTGSTTRPGGQQQLAVSHQDPQHPWSLGPTDISCDAVGHPQVLAPPETPCTVAQIQAAASSMTASPAGGLAITREANAGKGTGIPIILPGGEGRRELQAGSQGCESKQSS